MLELLLDWIVFQLCDCLSIDGLNGIQSTSSVFQLDYLSIQGSKMKI